MILQVCLVCGPGKLGFTTKHLQRPRWLSDGKLPAAPAHPLYTAVVITRFITTKVTFPIVYDELYRTHKYRVRQEFAIRSRRRRALRYNPQFRTKM